MGEIVHKIVGDVEKDAEYQNLTIELNADRKVHIHLKNLRIDLTVADYNKLYDAVCQAYQLLWK